MRFQFAGHFFIVIVLLLMGCEYFTDPHTLEDLGSDHASGEIIFHTLPVVGDTTDITLRAWVHNYYQDGVRNSLNTHEYQLQLRGHVDTNLAISTPDMHLQDHITSERAKFWILWEDTLRVLPSMDTITVHGKISPRSAGKNLVFITLSGEHLQGAKLRRFYQSFGSQPFLLISDQDTTSNRWFYADKDTSYLILE